MTDSLIRTGQGEQDDTFGQIGIDHRVRYWDRRVSDRRIYQPERRQGEARTGLDRRGLLERVRDHDSTILTNCGAVRPDTMVPVPCTYQNGHGGAWHVNEASGIRWTAV